MFCFIVKRDKVDSFFHGNSYVIQGAPDQFIQFNSIHFFPHNNSYRQ